MKLKINNISSRYEQVKNNSFQTKERKNKLGEVFTPTWLVDEMCSKASKKSYDKTLDLCAGFGQMTMGMLRNGLIDDLSNHTFCEKDGINIAKLKYIFGDDINVVDDYTKLTDKFEFTVTNPPFNRNIDLKIVSALEPLCEEMVIVHPSTWVLDLKGKSKLYGRFKDQLEGKVKSVELFNGNPVFWIGLFVPCVITHIGENSGKIEVDYFGDKFSVDSLDEVTKFGSNWHAIVKPFYEKMKNYCSENGSVWDENVFEIEEGKHYVQLAAIRGHVDLTGDGSRIVKDDFYTMVMENSEKNKGIRQTNLHRPGNPIPTIPFDSKNEQNNFINYLKTDFARFCLSLYKNGCDLGLGELSMIPWLDFTDSWNDEKLFAHFGVNEETQNYIRKFLPDFHGFRK